MRFTIRDVLWLTVVAALGVGWGIEHRRTAGPLQELAEYKRLEMVKRQEEAKAREQIERIFPGLLTSGGDTNLDWERAKAKSKELGAPQPTPIH